MRISDWSSTCALPISFADVAIGANQAGVAAAIQARGIGDSLFEAVLAQNAGGAQQAFGDLSGEILASTLSGLTDDSRHLRGALLSMIAPEAQGAFIWGRSEEHTSELQSLMRISYAVFCLKTKRCNYKRR